MKRKPRILISLGIRRTNRRVLPNGTESGASLLVWIGFVAIVGIFAVALLRSLVRETDHAVSRQEIATLNAQQAALEGWIMRNGCVPAPSGQTNWMQAVAAELGMEPASVAVNLRRQTRLLLIDTNGFQVLNPAGGTNSVALPYLQTPAGITNCNPPLNSLIFRPRVMIVSSLGQSLPAALGNYPAATEFAALWSCREGQVPATSAWSGWGRPDDVKIQRIDLSPLFLDLRLATSKSETNYGQFAIGASTPLFYAPVQLVSNPSRYIIRSTRLWLYTSQTSGGYLDSRQILNKNAFYRYEDGIWKGGSLGADMPGGLDLAAVVKGFLDATPNTNALNSTAQQQLVVGAMMNYMRNYIAWGQAGFPEAMRTATMLPLQDAMMTRCQELFKNGGGEPADNYPINLGPCQ